MSSLFERIFSDYLDTMVCIILFELVLLLGSGARCLGLLIRHKVREEEAYQKDQAEIHREAAQVVAKRRSMEGKNTSGGFFSDVDRHSIRRQLDEPEP